MRRLFLAAGGYSTLYLSLLATYATHLHFQINVSAYPTIPYVPKFLSKPFVLGGACLAGFSFGTLMIGNRKEFSHLLFNFFTYKKELKMIRDELYYS